MMTTMTTGFGVVLPWLLIAILIAIGTWIAYQLARQNGRILLRLESIENQIGLLSAPRGAHGKHPRERGGLPLGTVAPDFELPDLTGVRHKLSELRGKDVLLIFFNPQCGFCTKMAADLAALPPDGADGRPVPVVVTTGDADENREFFQRQGIRCLVLLQKKMEVAAQFRAQGTPMGYRIDGAGNIASELTVGADSLLKLALNGKSQRRPPKGGTTNGPPEGGTTNSLARSRLNRNGLKAGTPAPDFTLPKIDGGELSLADFRGKPVLLVFSDAHCGPCDELAPHLKKLHEHQEEPQVLVVSRGDVEPNRAKAERLGLTYPIVLQRSWEISLKYAKFATPIGYLIDEQGIIASDVAVGVGPILALAGERGPDSRDRQEAQIIVRAQPLALAR